jgi:hypothetical protein
MSEFARPQKITFAEMREQGVRDQGLSLSKVEAERGSRDPSHANSQNRYIRH